jgi:uncharacterized protein (UPF0332 family)
MAFEGTAFLQLADWLTANAGTNQLPVSAEAAYRSAVSRAYYGAFLTAMALLVRRQEYKPAGDASDHSAVMRAYQTHNSHARRQIGTWLDRLRGRRNRADYDLLLDATMDIATAATRDARKVLDYLATQ